MEHFRFLLMQALAMPAPLPVPAVPDNPMLMMMATFISQVKVNGFVAWLIQKMKESQSPALSWISKNTPWVTRFVALAGASFTAIGIHWTFTGSTLMVTGLSLATIIPTVYNVAQNYLFQHAWWKVAFAGPIVAPAAVPAKPAA